MSNPVYKCIYIYIYIYIQACGCKKNKTDKKI